MVKLFEGHLFIGWIGPPDLIEQLQEYNLELFGKFIAVSQVSIGYLMLTSRFKLLGSIMLVPMILCILLFTISQKWIGTPYVLGVLLVMNFSILWQYRRVLIPILELGKPAKSEADALGERRKSKLGNLVWLTGLVLQFAAIKSSEINLQSSFLLSGIGIILSILSFKLDHSTPKGTKDENIPTLTFGR